MKLFSVRFAIGSSVAVALPTYLLAVCMAVLGVTPQARSAESDKPLTQAEVQAAYQNCPVGYYSGPRPGKSRYTKDEYLRRPTRLLATDVAFDWDNSGYLKQVACVPPNDAYLFLDRNLNQSLDNAAERSCQVQSMEHRLTPEMIASYSINTIAKGIFVLIKKKVANDMNWKAAA